MIPHYAGRIVMNLAEYEQAVADTDILDPDDLVLPMLGLAGEIGSLVAQYKKIQRDHTGYRAFSEEVREELGDLFWYATALARRCNLSLDEILADKRPQDPRTLPATAIATTASLLRRQRRSQRTTASRTGRHLHRVPRPRSRRRARAGGAHPSRYPGCR